MVCHGVTVFAVEQSVRFPFEGDAASAIEGTSASAVKRTAVSVKWAAAPVV